MRYGEWRTTEERACMQEIALPAIQTMPAYIHRHYERQIAAALLRALERDGRGEVPISVYIERMYFRRVGYTMVYAGLTLALAGTERRYRADLWLDMEDGIRAEYGNFRAERGERRRDGVPLDDYLVPVLSRAMIDEEAEEILARFCPEGLRDPGRLEVERLVSALGLEIVNLALDDRPETASILFFEAGSVAVRSEGMRRVAANTIVVNRESACRFSRKDAVFHECFHYIEHRLFFQLQKMHMSDLSALSDQRKVCLTEEKRNPVEWIEWQARCGSQCLQMPRSLMTRRIREELAERRDFPAHMGQKLHAVGMKLAGEFDAPRFRIRNRMIQLGYSAAKGALNYVDGAYIAPFAFETDACRGGKTFVIGKRDALCEYVRSAAFRAMIDSGRYIYADGHICLNDPQFVTHMNARACLTDRANARVDRCCLRFETVYVRKGQRYIFGRLNSDEEYNARCLSLSLPEGRRTALACARAMSHLLMELPGSFSGTLRAHMTRQGMTIERLSESTGISVRSINRLRNEERAGYALEQVILICLALHLPPEFSLDLIEKAGLRLRSRPEDLIYGAVLRTMYKEPLSAIQAALHECGGPELKIREAL